MSDVHPATPMGSPPQRAAMTLVSHAAAAWAEWQRQSLSRLADWDRLTVLQREKFTAAIDVAVNVQTGRILAEAARYKAERDKLDADCQQLVATLTRLGNSHADMRAALERIRHHPPRDGLDLTEEAAAMRDIAREALEPS